MSRLDKSSPKSRSSQPIYYASALWAFAAAMYFLTQNLGKPDDSVYHFVTAIFEIVAFFAAGILCFRNVLGSNNVSGKDVWLGLGLGMASYCIGSCLFTYWEVGLSQDPDVSPGDLFYVLSYIFLLYGMVMAVIKRQLNLDLVQWMMVMTMGVLGVVFALFVNNVKPAAVSPQAVNFFEAPAIAATTENVAVFDHPMWPTVEIAQAPTVNATVKPAVKTTVKPSPSSPTANPTASLKPPSPTNAPKIEPLKVPAVPLVDPSTKPKAETKKIIPEWARGMDDVLKPYKDAIQWIYVVADVCLVVIATALLTAFWGGRFSQSWQIIAFAAFSLYIADMWVKYATKVYEPYNSGSLPEVFFVFAGILFAVGATLEHDLSQSRRSARRRG